MIAQETYDVIMANKEKLNSAVIYDRDFEYVSPTGGLVVARRLGGWALANAPARLA